jgi:hypothetical protein
LFAVAALVPSIASAGPGGMTENTAYQYTVCDPDSSHCQTWNQGDSTFWSGLASIGMPEHLFDYCAYQSSYYCPRKTNNLPDRQIWYFQWVDASATGYYYNIDPTQGVPGGVKNHASNTLWFNCVETDDYEDYTCTTGTGGPWGSYIMTVRYW